MSSVTTVALLWPLEDDDRDVVRVNAINGHMPSGHQLCLMSEPGGPCRSGVMTGSLAVGAFNHLHIGEFCRVLRTVFGDMQGVVLMCVFEHDDDEGEWWRKVDWRHVPEDVHDLYRPGYDV